MTNLSLQCSDFLPVLVELDGKVTHLLHGFVGEGHVHVDLALPTGHGAADL